MTRPVSELAGADLALWVARAIGWKIGREDGPKSDLIYWDSNGNPHSFSKYGFWPHEDWSQGGPLIDKHDIFFERSNYPEEGAVFAFIYTPDGSDVLAQKYGPTLLIAAMRALVASVYGDTVPDEVAP